MHALGIVLLDLRRSGHQIALDPIKSPSAEYNESIGAGDGIRTRDQELGKLLLYQLSYARSSGVERGL